jgi:hypothetical protein
MAQWLTATRLRTWITIAWTLLNLLAVIGGTGGLPSLLTGITFGLLVTLGMAGHAKVRYRADQARVRGHEIQQRRADIAYWRAQLEHPSAAQRKVAVDLLAYWGEPVDVDPLEHPLARARRLQVAERLADPIGEACAPGGRVS